MKQGSGYIFSLIGIQLIFLYWGLTNPHFKANYRLESCNLMAKSSCWIDAIRELFAVLVFSLHGTLELVIGRERIRHAFNSLQYKRELSQLPNDRKTV